MSRHSTHSAKPDTLVCTLPEPWLYRAGRRGDAITDLRYVEARLRANPSLHHIHVADSVRSAETLLSHAGITRSSRALRVLDLAYLPKWTFELSDWEHLLRDLACHHMAHNATIHLELPIAQIMDNPNGLKALATRFGHLHRIRSYAASGRLSPAADIHASFSNLQPFRSDCRHLLR